MLTPLTVVIVALSVAAIVLAAIYALRDRLFDDIILGTLALLELAVLVQAVVSVVRVGALHAERATFVAYGLSLVVVAPFVAWTAIKEKSRWSMAAVAVGTFTVAVMTGRMQQIWGLNA